jgi:hypothetical protein
MQIIKHLRATLQVLGRTFLRAARATFVGTCRCVGSTSQSCPGTSMDGAVEPGVSGFFDPLRFPRLLEGVSAASLASRNAFRRAAFCSVAFSATARSAHTLSASWACCSFFLKLASARRRASSERSAIHLHLPSRCDRDALEKLIKVDVRFTDEHWPVGADAHVLGG